MERNEEKHPWTVAVDLDCVLADYEDWKGLDQIGAPILGATEFVERLLGLGFEVVIWTTRTNVSINPPGSGGFRAMPEEAWHRFLIRQIETWLDQHGFPALAEGSFWVYDKPGKPIATAYVDDKAVRCRPLETPDPRMAYLNAMKDCIVFRSELRGDGAGDAEKVVGELTGAMGLDLPEGMTAEEHAAEAMPGAVDLFRLVDLIEAAVQAGAWKQADYDVFKCLMREIADRLGTVDGQAYQDKMETAEAPGLLERSDAQIAAGAEAGVPVMEDQNRRTEAAARKRGPKHFGPQQQASARRRCGTCVHAVDDCGVCNLDKASIHAATVCAWWEKHPAGPRDGEG